MSNSRGGYRSPEHIPLLDPIDDFGDMSGQPAYPFPEEPVGDLEAHDKTQIVQKSTWKGRIWDTFDRPPLERKLLLKVDAVILTFASIKNLDQQNTNTAFLSGMKEDLNMYGNQLVTSTSIWTVGYVIGQIPANLLLTRIEPRWVIPTLELGWGIATLGSYAVKSYKSLYALRFLVGLFESGFYPGIHYLLGSWYTPAEIGKRAMIFWLAGSLGQMFSGFLQSAAYNNLSGIHGIAGWRWLFIIDAIITLPIAIFGFFFFPPLPLQDKKSWWLTEDEFELARTRLQKIGRAGRKPWSWKKLKNLFLSWHTYFLPLLYVIWNNQWPQPAIGYWLKSFNSKTNPPVPGKTYTVSQINLLPLPQTAIFVVCAASFAWLSDGVFRGGRWPFVYIGAVYSLIIAAIMRTFPLYKNINTTFALFYISQIGQEAGPLILTFINELCSDDTEKRALLVAAANDLAYVVQAVAPNFVWKTTDFPRAKKGWTWSLVLNILLIVWMTAILLLIRRDNKRRRQDESEGSSQGDLHERYDGKDLDSVDGSQPATSGLTFENNRTTVLH
ncbi:pantothenate transporter [Kwoniella mangroviensis CBS 8886]|nr:pantothenate transporter [Kwoniella mangroviensis CBS 8886]